MVTSRGGGRAAFGDQMSEEQERQEGEPELANVVADRACDDLVEAIKRTAEWLAKDDPESVRVWLLEDLLGDKPPGAK